jgi:hypothetical protein
LQGAIYVDLGTNTNGKLELINVVLDQTGAGSHGCGVYLNIPNENDHDKFIFNGIRSTQVGGNGVSKEVILVSVNNLDNKDSLKNNFNGVCSNQKIVIKNGSSEIPIDDIICEKPCENTEYVIELFMTLFIYRHYETNGDDCDCSKSCTYELKDCSNRKVNENSAQKCGSDDCYIDGINEGFCTPCEDGVKIEYDETFGGIKCGITVIKTCIICNPGMMINSNKDGCDDCKTGEYSDPSEEISCTRCSSGTILNSNKDGCDDCETRQYNNLTNKMECLKCPDLNLRFFL